MLTKLTELGKTPFFIGTLILNDFIYELMEKSGIFFVYLDFLYPSIHKAHA